MARPSSATSTRAAATRTIEDFRNFVKLAYMTPALHHSGGTVCEPVDLPVNKRHLDMVYSHITLFRQAVHGLGHASGARAQDTVEMAKILFGEEFVEKNCVITSLINANSPMVFDGTMLGALKVYARANQACIVIALHPGRRDEPGDGGRHAGAGAGRGARRCRTSRSSAVPARR